MEPAGQTLAFPGRIGLGTWKLGEDSSQREHEIGALAHAFEIGYRMLDTAERYADGGAEQVVGAALKAFGSARRHEVFVVGKIQPKNATRERMVRACEASIRRMDCDYLDLFLLHWPGSGPDRFSDPLRGFNELRRRGLIRHYGVSNFSEDDLNEWLDTERHLGTGSGVQCNQVRYSPEARGIENGLLGLQRKHSISTMAYSPLQSSTLPSGTLVDHPMLKQLAASRGVTPAQIALAWCVRDRDVVAVAKSANPKRLEENLAAADLRLTDAELRAIDRAFPIRLRRLRQSGLVRAIMARIRRLRRRT